MAWSDKKQPDKHAVIEIMDNGIYSEQIKIEFRNEQKSLQIRAGKDRTGKKYRPVIYPLDRSNRLDSLTVTGAGCSHFTLDGVLVSGLGIQVYEQLAELTIRHSTLVPGWTTDSRDEMQQTAEQNSDSYAPSLEIFSPNVSVKIERSILGAIQVNPTLPEQEKRADSLDQNADDNKNAQQITCQGACKNVCFDPIRIRIEDSILDSVDENAEVIGAPGCLVAYAAVTVRRSTLIGRPSLGTFG